MENEQAKIENILHVFDLIKDNVINAKIGKMLAEVIADTGETAEHVIKTVGLKQCMPDDEDVLNIIRQFPDLCQEAKNGSDDALHELVGRCMRMSGGKLNPNLVRNAIVNFDYIMNKSQGESIRHTHSETSPTHSNKVDTTMAEGSLARQFHTAVMAYFPMTRLDEESGIIKAKWELKPHYQEYVTPMTQYSLLVDAGICQSLCSAYPMLVPADFDLEFNTETGETSVSSFVTGYPDWPKVHLKDITELVKFLSLIFDSDVYSAVRDYQKFPENILTTGNFQ